jgi:hypothetical protein
MTTFRRTFIGAIRTAPTPRSALRYLVGPMLMISALGSGCGASSVSHTGLRCDRRNVCRTRNLRCATSATFPGGYCTRRCNRPEQCPSGSYCVQVHGGICMQKCRSHTQCRSAEGYSCVDIPVQGGVGDARVCGIPALGTTRPGFSVCPRHVLHRDGRCDRRGPREGAEQRGAEKADTRISARFEILPRNRSGRFRECRPNESSEGVKRTPLSERVSTESAP